MSRIKLVVLSMSLVILSAALMGSLIGCSSEDGQVGNFIDRTLWEMRGYPTQEEITTRLQEKYGEDFVVTSLNSGARFYQGVAHPVNNKAMVFSLEMKDENGNPMAIEYMRDDFSARLAEHDITRRVLPLVKDHFGDENVIGLRVEVGLFDRLTEASLPAPDFAWIPDDGLAALYDLDEISTELTINVVLRSSMDSQTSNDESLAQLAESITNDAGVPLNANLVIRSEEDNGKAVYLGG